MFPADILARQKQVRLTVLIAAETKAPLMLLVPPVIFLVWQHQNVSRLRLAQHISQIQHISAQKQSLTCTFFMWKETSRLCSWWCYFNHPKYGSFWLILLFVYLVLTFIAIQKQSTSMGELPVRIMATFIFIMSENWILSNLQGIWIYWGYNRNIFKHLFIFRYG